MGIFDKKPARRKGDDFDSPVEHIDLSSAPTKAAEESEDEAKEAAAPAAEAAAEPAEAPKPATTPSYGIEQAIALMRTLPQESVELVVSVVKHTLESTKIDLPTIIEDATRKQERIAARIKVLKAEIEDLQSEIQTRTKEIGELEEDNKETTMVKDRLELAVKLDSGSAAGKSGGERRRTSTKASVPPPMPNKPASSTKPSGSGSSGDKPSHTVVSKK
jgi:hypothetical protein